jgi:hypothetical protein
VSQPVMSPTGAMPQKTSRTVTRRMKAEDERREYSSSIEVVVMNDGEQGGRKGVGRDGVAAVSPTGVMLQKTSRTVTRRMKAEDERREYRVVV